MEGANAGGAHPAPSPDLHLASLLADPRLLLVVALLVAGAWALTLATAEGFESLLMALPMGSPLGDAAAYVVLAAVMMTAMMLPTAVPMVAAYAQVAHARGPRGLAAAHTALFSSAYIALWAAMTALSLPLLSALGLMGSMGGAAAFAPGAVLVAAGVYQFTAWKAFCLRHCRTPLGLLMTKFRPGAAGALRLGLGHGLYCLGCCWLLMLVWFVAAAMSALWMAVFTVFILAEKAGDRDGRVSRAMGAACVAVGTLSLALVWAAPPM